MSVCLYELPDPEMKNVNLLEIWADDYSADTLWVVDEDDGELYMTRDQASWLATHLHEALENTA